MTTIEGKPEISYPCKWGYKMIGRDAELMRKVASDLIGKKLHTIKESNKSSKGTFVSLHLELVVDSEDERVYIYEELKKNSCFLHIL